VKRNELLRDLLNLDKNKSTGTDYIGPKILKVSALNPYISSFLAMISWSTTSKAFLDLRV
jgi:hypothetical protein